VQRAFYSDYTDMQSTGDKVVGVDEDPDSPNFGEPVTAWTTDNLSNSEIYGLEFEFDVIPWSDGRLFGYAAWLDTSIQDPGSFEDGYACAERIIYDQPECGSPQTADIRGNQLPFCPGILPDAQLRTSLPAVVGVLDRTFRVDPLAEQDVVRHAQL
jgi:iron complex outermembrane receptor protein